MDVVKNADIIGAKENLPEEEMNILKIAAMVSRFRLSEKIRRAREESVKMAEKFLELHGVDKKSREA